jgi:DNA-binding response OmpR family regulator
MVEKPSVLVVERGDALRESLTRLLEAKGYVVHAVESRARGFDLLDELVPDLLILDDPGQGQAYRLVWLNDTDQPDVRVELLDLQPGALAQQLEGVVRSVA